MSGNAEGAQIQGRRNGRGGWKKLVGSGKSGINGSLGALVCACVVCVCVYVWGGRQKGKR
jgi:hypothetical protein